MTAPSPNLKGWLPIGVTGEGSKAEIDWRYFGTKRLTEPFFNDSLRQIMTRPFTKAFRQVTDMQALDAWAKTSPGIAPSGFIFHMSRCGSTLAAQMLSALPDSIVIKEAPVIDALLSGGFDQSEADRLRSLQSLISALGQPRGGSERHYVVKFDCWHMRHIEFIVKAFPTTPWIFLYREPNAVLASHLHQRGGHTVASLVDPRNFGIDPEKALHMPPAEYCARVLASICAEAADAIRADATVAKLGKLINYADLPRALFDVILPHFDIAALPSDHASMAVVSQSHSKHPDQAFSATLDVRALSPDAEAAVQTYLAAPYQDLESIRLTADRPK